MNKHNNDFFQPIISVFGLAISIITSLLPLFEQNFMTTLFINSSLPKPFSFISFILGISIIWLIWNFNPYPYINLWKKTDAEGQQSYKFKLDPHNVLWALIVLSAFFSSMFILIGITTQNQNEPNSFLAISQGLLYLLFFLSLISIFAFLFIQTKLRFESEEIKNNLPYIIFETLEKNRLVKPGIEIYENKQLDFNETQKYGLSFGLYRKFKVVTQPQKREVLEFISTNNGDGIIKLLRKEEQEK